MRRFRRSTHIKLLVVKRGRTVRGCQHSGLLRMLSLVVAIACVCFDWRMIGAGGQETTAEAINCPRGVSDLFAEYNRVNQL